MKTGKEYIGPYKVVRVFRKSARRQVIKRGLTEKEAQALTKKYPSNQRSMVVYFKQYWADKYFV